MARKPLQPFETEQNPGAITVLRPLIETLGQKYFLHFFPNIVQQQHVSSCCGGSDGPLKAFAEQADFVWDDCTDDVRLACVNGRACRGTSFLPAGKFRMGIFMCDKRFSNRNPDNPTARKSPHSKGIAQTLHPECFERCLCLACAVHSLVRTSFFCINCCGCLQKLRGNGDRHLTAHIPPFPIEMSSSYVAALAPYPDCYKYTQLSISFIVCHLKQQLDLVRQVLLCSYATNMMDYLVECHIPLHDPGIEFLAKTVYTSRCLSDEDRSHCLIVKRGMLTVQELHEMFALVAQRLLGDRYEFFAHERMKGFTLGMVTHMRPISLGVAFSGV